MSRGPDSPIAASLAASSICASSYEQMVLAPAEANVQIVDVHVHLGGGFRVFFPEF